jgi:nucleotide-binding universal stress UspA family protein
MRWWRVRNRAAESTAPRTFAAAPSRPGPLPLERLGATPRVVLAGVDGTRSGRLALRVAAEHAACLGAELVGVHVLPEPPWLWTMAPELLAQASQWRQDVEAEAFFDTAAAAALVGVEWSFALGDGDVASILGQEAKDRTAFLVVVAVHAEHRGLHRCPARRLAQTCERPVFVVDADTCRLFGETS